MPKAVMLFHNHEHCNANNGDADAAGPCPHYACVEIPNIIEMSSFRLIVHLDLFAKAVYLNVHRVGL